MFKLPLLALATVICVGCATQEVQPKSTALAPAGSDWVLASANRLLEAYDNNDSKTWSELTCTTAKTERVFGLAAQKKVLGEFSSPRLVSVSSETSAGNAGGHAQWPQVAIEVQASGYPVGKLLLKFVGERDGKCVGIIF